MLYVLHLWGLTCGEVVVYFMSCICGGLHVGKYSYIFCLAFVGAYMWGSIRIFHVLHLWGLACGGIRVTTQRHSCIW